MTEPAAAFSLAMLIHEIMTRDHNHEAIVTDNEEARQLKDRMMDNNRRMLQELRKIAVQAGWSQE